MLEAGWTGGLKSAEAARQLLSCSVLAGADDVAGNISGVLSRPPESVLMFADRQH